jgi:hypothetical protein
MRATVLIPLIVACVVCGSAHTATPPSDKPGDKATLAPEKPGGVREIEWELLLPEAERANFSMTPPPPVHDYLGEGGMAAAQSGSFDVNKQLDEMTVKLPGFVVPLDTAKDGLVSEFFLVPYFGACIHVPPPPPNQIVYVRMKEGVRLESMYDAFWVTGKMHTKSKGSRFGMAAYSMDAQSAEPYKY